MWDKDSGTKRFCAALLTLALGACSNGGSSGDKNVDPVDPGGNGGDNGGGALSYTVGGTITGLEGQVTLSLNGEEERFTASPFTFTARVEEGRAYGVGFVGSDTGQICTMSNNAGTASGNVTDILVTCSALLTEIRFVDGLVYGHLAAGDYNGDGDTDLVVGIRGNEFHTGGGNVYPLRIMWGNGAGGFTQGPDLTAIRHHYSWIGMSLQSVNTNNDGIDDLAILTPQGLEVYTGQAAGDPVRVNNIAPYSAGMLFPADVTQDGNEDYVSLYAGLGIEFFGVLPGNGDAGFSDPIRSGSLIDSQSNDLGFFGAVNMTLADFNGDLLPDVLSVSAGQESVMLGFFAGNGDGTFAYPSALQAMPTDLHTGQNLGTTEGALRAIAHGDIDLDGDRDLVIASSTDFVLVLLNDGVGNFTEGARVITGLEPVRVALADLNFDGRLDLIAANQGAKTLSISWGLSDGSFGNRGDGDDEFFESQLDNRTDFTDLVIADFDNNALLDIAISERDSRLDGFGAGSVKIILNPGM